MASAGQMEVLPSFIFNVLAPFLHTRGKKKQCISVYITNAQGTRVCVCVFTLASKPLSLFIY